MMHLEQPIWGLLLAPLAVVVWFWPGATRVLMGLRVGAMGLVVLGMCRPVLTLPDRRGTVVVVADRSLSMPEEAAAAQEEAIRVVAGGMGRGDRLAVVSFGRGVGVERAVGEGDGFEGFTLEVGGDGSDLGAAIERAAGLVEPGSPGRLLVLSDGRWTGSDPVAAAGRVARVGGLGGGGVDYRVMSRASAGDVAIESVDIPAEVGPGEGFTVTAWVRSPVPGRVRYVLERRDGGGLVTVAKGERGVGAGLERLTFRDRAGGPGTAAYLLRVEPVSDAGDGGGGGVAVVDPVPANNRVEMLMGVTGPRPILVVTPGEGSGLVRLLNAGGLEVVRRSAGEVDWTLAGLSGYSGLILENVPASGLGEAGMATVAKWVNGSGAGMMMTGGMQSFGPGGYYRSPLESVLPVTMELRQEHRKLALAIVVALDRSGSMTAPVTGGKTKMDLANLGTAEVVDLLSPMDELGVIAVDTSPHVIQALGPVEDKGEIRSRVLRIESRGGGIYVEEALREAATMLEGAKASTRHIVLFADAADAVKPGRYVELIRRAREAGITVSVIGLGTRADPDAGLLEDIAKRGGGRLLLTTDATQLPRLFAEDTFVVARSSFIDEVTRVEATAALGLMTGGALVGGGEAGEVPAVGGYNLVYEKGGVEVGLRAVDEYKGPVVATWRVGTGRVAVYTGEADGEHAGPIAGWGGVGELFSSLARWLSERGQALPDGMMLVQRVEQGRGRVSVELHLDPERAGGMGVERIPTVTTLRGGGGVGEGVKESKAVMGWRSADVLGVDVVLDGEETALSTVDMGVYGTRTLPPVRLMYSPEYAPVEDAGAGERVLASLAAATGGERRVDLAAIWERLPRVAQGVGIAHWLLLGAAALVLLEVVERRTGLLTSGRWRELAVAKLAERRESRVAARSDKAATREAKGRRRAAGEAARLPERGEVETAKSEGAAAGWGGGAVLSDALRQARDRAGRRTGGR